MMVDGSTIRPFKIKDPETGQEFTVEMSILDRIYLRMLEDIAAGCKR